MTHVTAFLAGFTAAVKTAPAGMPAFGWDDVNPVKVLANLVAVGATSVWQDIMTNIWSAGLWLTGFVFQLVDAFTAPDLSGSGLMSKIYPFTFGIGAGLAVILALVQVGFAAWQRDGKGLGRLMVGVFQFMLVWGGMLGIGAALNVATAGLTQGMLQVSFGAPSFAKANLLRQWDIRQGVDAVTATVLGICGVFLVFASIGYLLVMLVRAAALMILMATSPISAAGLLSESTGAWFWKSLRWFLAALMIGPLAALVLAIGKLLVGQPAGATRGSERSARAARRQHERHLR
jgi:type IV secretion system protein TrbL